jgi:SAM-dependent methyltransferase
MTNQLSLIAGPSESPRMPAFEASEQRALGQYPTPYWVAEALWSSKFSHLTGRDVVLDPTCGPGRLLSVIPKHIRAIGVEMSPAVAQSARDLTGREIITGDFCAVDLPAQPTAIFGNPPFELSVIDRIMQRAYAILPNGGQMGLILPAYMFQTAKRVAAYARTWSISQEMIPRNIYEGLKLPLCFSVFEKTEGRRFLIGFALYREAAAIQDLSREYRAILDHEPRGPVWRSTVLTALSRLGGEADIAAIYREIEGKRPTANPFWREKVRQSLQRYCARVRKGVYRLPEEIALAA